MIDRLDCPAIVNAVSTLEDSHKTNTKGNIMTVRTIQATLEYFRNTCMTVREPKPKPSTPIRGVCPPTKLRQPDDASPDLAQVTGAISKQQVSLFTADTIVSDTTARAACEEFLMLSSVSGLSDRPLQALLENYQYWTSKFGLPKLSKQAFADVLWAVGCEVKLPDLRSKSRSCNRAEQRSRPKTSCNKQLSLPLGT